MGRTLIAILIGTAGAAYAESPCNPGTVGQPNPALPDYNPYHPDADWDGDGIPNKDDTDKDGDGVADCEDTEVYTRPSQNPHWPADKPIPWWDGPRSDDRPLSDPTTLAADDAWLASFDGPRGWTGGSNNPSNFLPPFNLTGDPDGDGIPNWMDSDDDGDGIDDWADPDHPMYDPTHPSADMDCDGIPNSEDDDIDGDGIPNECDPNPEDGCVPDTEPIDSEDCGGEPPRPQPPSRPGPPPPHDRPDPSPPDDTPDPPDPPDRPTPPDDPKIPPGGGGPGDKSCCEAICERLDILIELGRQTVDQLYEIHALAVEANYYDQLLYKRLISDGDSFRNRVDNGLWTIADLMQLVLHESKYTNDLLYYMADNGGMGGPGVPPPPGPSGDVPPVGESRSGKMVDLLGNSTAYGGRVKGDLQEWTGSWDGLRQFRELVELVPDESRSAPVWEFEIPFPAIGGFEKDPLQVAVDFAFYDPIRLPVYLMIYSVCLINGLKMVWEELRRYG